MFGIGYLKASPTTYVFQYINGKPEREGKGLSFYYFAPRSVIVQVPLSSVDVVREPFVSKTSSADIIAGSLEAGGEITVESEMASNGVIFSDGVESDALEFNAGMIARIRAASGKARLVIK